MKLNVSKPLATISIDLDNQWSYMKIRGDSGWEKFPSYFDILIPRFLDILDELKLKITFFIVGQDATLKKNLGSLALLTERGHEVGNHSFHHEPWLHLYKKEQLRMEIVETEKYIIEVTRQKPVGFRGPGFSLHRDLIEILAENSYIYDASAFSTYLGPFARLYYFWAANLTDSEKNQRKELFGSFKDGLRSVKPFFWELSSGQRFLEIPVTTIPIIKIPFHLSYLLYLSLFSEILMLSYLKFAISSCKIVGMGPSFLLHPLDLLGGEEVPGLAFFPAMKLNRKEKLKIFKKVINILLNHFEIVNMITFAGALIDNTKMRIIHG